MLRTMLTEVMHRADDAGLGRQGLANRLHATIETVKSWVAPRRCGNIPGWRLYELMVVRWILPEAVREWMIVEICRQAGFIAVRETATDMKRRPALEQVAEITAALGELAADTAAVTSSGSDGGRRITRGEAEELLTRVGPLMQRAEELNIALKRASDEGRSTGSRRGATR